MRQTLGTTVIVLTAILLLPIQGAAQSTPAFAAAADKFATPVHCAWFTGQDQSGDGITSGYAADMVLAMDAGNSVGMTNDAVMAALQKTCADKAHTTQKS